MLCRGRMDKQSTIALVLSGGGARAAYQVGVLLGIAQLLPAARTNPFPIICGTSAGAINAAALASGAGDFRSTVHQLAHVWKHLHTEDVYDASLLYFLKTFLHFGVAILSAGRAWHNPRSILDNKRLRHLLARVMELGDIQSSLDQGFLSSVALTASCYTTGGSVTFFQAQPSVAEWQRYQRVGVRETLSVDHLLATSSIPLLFPAVRLGNRYYCDGAVRQLSPLSPALHLGGQKLFIVGLAPAPRYPAGLDSPPASVYPSPAQVFGHLLNSVFLDSMALDTERLIRVNHTVSLLQNQRALARQTTLKQIEFFMLNPSQSLESIALKHLSAFPPVLRFLLSGTGGTHGRGAVLATYLLFEPGYIRELITLGLHDTLQQKEQIKQFLAFE